MFPLQLLENVSWIAVTVATVSAFALGGLWYSKALFANGWLQEVGLSEEAMQNAHVAKTFGGTFALQFLAATALAITIGTDGGWRMGLHTGLMIGVCWIMTAYGITYLFEQRSMRLWLINAGYYVVAFAIMGVIIGVMQ